MTKQKSRHLLEMLAEVPDSRKSQGKRHPLPAILGLTVVAMLCGCRSYSAVEKGHGWIQTRTLTASTVLTDTDYVEWPGLAQVYQY